ncbi:hypothetical protein ACPTHP_35945, partial [Pseudomonas aeruginosa]
DRRFFFGFVVVWFLFLVFWDKGVGCVLVLVVDSRDGLDELSLAAASVIAELKDGEVRVYDVRPEEFGIKSETLMGLE